MKNSCSLFRLLLMGIALAMTPTCGASPDTDMKEDNIFPFTLLPQEVQWQTFGHLTPTEHAKVAPTCKLWHQSFQEHLANPLRSERGQMLHDPVTPFQHFTPVEAEKSLTLTLEQDGFVFVPFGHEAFLKNLNVISDQDVIPLLPHLYAKAFGTKEHPLSPEDVACLKAVMPWSRIALTSTNQETSKEKALESLLGLEGNPRLVRFSKELPLQLLKSEPRTLVLTFSELTQHQDFLPPFFAAHPDQQVHLVADDAYFAQKYNTSNWHFAFIPSEKILDLPAKSLSTVRHLILSDPHHMVTGMGSRFLMDAKDLLSVDIKGFNKVQTLQPGFLKNATSLCEQSKKKIQQFKDEVAKRRPALHPDFNPVAYLSSGAL